MVVHPDLQRGEERGENVGRRAERPGSFPSASWSLCVLRQVQPVQGLSLSLCKTEKGGGDGPDFSATLQPSFSIT